MEDVVEYIGIAVSGDKSRFGVIVKGDSMSPRVNAGDVVVVSETQEVRNGDLAIVLWNDGECALRIVNFSGENITLSSMNLTKYPPTIVNKNNVHRLLRVVMRVEKL